MNCAFLLLLNNLQFTLSSSPLMLFLFCLNYIPLGFYFMLIFFFNVHYVLNKNNIRFFPPRWSSSEILFFFMVLKKKLFSKTLNFWITIFVINKNLVLNITLRSSGLYGVKKKQNFIFMYLQCARIHKWYKYIGVNIFIALHFLCNWLIRICLYQIRKTFCLKNCWICSMWKLV